MAATFAVNSLESWDYIASYGDLRNWALQDSVLNTTDSANAVWQNGLSASVGGNRVITFNAYDYLASNVDLINWLGADGIQHSDFIAAAQHYIAHGVNEGRTITFDAAAYFAANPDLAAYATWLGVSNDEAAAIHYITAGRFEIAAGAVGRSAVGTPLIVGKTFTLTAGSDTSPAYAGTAGNDTYIANRDTLTAGDNLVGNGGADTLVYSDSYGTSSYKGAIGLHGIEAVTTTIDNGGSVGFDLSGSDGINSVESNNATGSVFFNQLTALADVKVTDVTNSGNVTVHFQDSVVVGAADSVNLILANNYNISPIGNIQIGSVSAANSGVETLNVTVAGSDATITTLDSNITTLNVADGDAAGHHNLTILNALNPTITTVDAHTFTGNLTIDLRGDNNTLKVTTGTGNDVIHLDGVLGNDTITTGAGNDTVYLGLGHDTVDLGAGNDTLYIVPNGLTVDDTITGGDGVDTIVLTGSDNISLSEAEKVTAVEKLVLKGSGVNYDGLLNRFWLGLGSNIVVADHLLTTLSAGSSVFTVDTQSYVGSNTIDITNVTFSNTAKFELDASSKVANNELVIANDATVNAKAILNFGAGLGDTLRVLDGASITADDLSNISGLERIELQAKSLGNQLWDIQVTDALVAQSTSGVGVDIWIDNDVPAGSIVNIDASALTTAGIRVHTNSNVTLHVTGAGAGFVTQINSRYFTSTGDALVGTAGNDTFVADNLGQVQNGDSAFGLAGVDTLLLNFAVYNEAIPLFGPGNSLYNITLNSVENIVFNANRLDATDHPVAFIDNANAVGGIVTGVLSYTTGDGNDIIHGNINSSDITYNLGNGDNNYYDPATAIHETVIAGTGNDHVHFHANGWSNPDVISLSTGTDQISVDLSGGLNVSGWSHVSGVDIINVNSSVGANVFTLDNSIVTQSDTGHSIVINATDHAGGISVDAAAVTVPNSVTINVINDTTALHNTSQFVDFAGGAGDDTIHVIANGSVDGIIIRGNGGADTINLENDTLVGHRSQVIEFATGNDGAAQGLNTGYDVINGFQTTIDKVQVALGEGLEAVVDVIAPGLNTIQWVTDGPIIFGSAGGPVGTGEALLLTHGATALTDADLTAVNFTNVLQRINVDVTYAGINPGGLVVAEGQNDSAVYFVADQNHNGLTDLADVKLLGVFHNVHLVTGDFQIA